ncbi:sensor histidine kinase [Candidatus Berkelbacteria bacterium]|nr:sensor histidine kinase [Candidatus Berkelbacteria bacterium]
MLKKTLGQFLNKFPPTNKYFGRILIVFVLAHIALLSFIYLSETTAFNSQVKDRAVTNVARLVNFLDSEIQKVSIDVLTIAEQNATVSYFLTKDDLDLSILEGNLESICKNNLRYDQVRVFDLAGMEKARINCFGGNPEVVSAESLQNKSQRYYFKESKDIKAGQVYLSRLDLNVENNIVEFPLKPTLRFIAPIVDKEDTTLGFVDVNYLAKNIFNDLDLFFRQQNSEITIVDQSGYYLKSENEFSDFGFMIPENSEHKISNDNPQLWQALNSTTADNLTDNGDYMLYQFYDPTLATRVGLRPQLPGFSSSKWGLIYSLKEEGFVKNNQRVLVVILIIGLPILVLLVFLAWYLSNLILKRVEAEKKTENLNDVLRVITRILRHDLMNKFTGIQDLIEVYGETKDKESIEIAHEAALSGKETIRNMKKLELLVAENHRLELYDLRTEIKAAAKDCKVPFKVKGKGKVLADPALRSIFDNLISNAIRHGKTKKIEVDINKKGDLTEIEVIDFGKGIPVENREDIFLEGVTKGETGNTGIGLYIVKKTIERYGGKIWIEDNKPKGTKFVMQLHNKLGGL